jgi:hypothetical protein
MLSVCLRTPYLVSTLLFYGSPGLYITLRRGHKWQVAKSFLFAVVVSIPFAIVVDFVGTTSHVWYVRESLFPFRFLNVIPVEDLVWLVVATYTIVILYASVLDKGKHELADARMSYFIVPASVALSAFFLFLVFGSPTLLSLDSRFTYLFLGTAFFALPAGLFLWRFPSFIERLIGLVTYFLYVTILFEIVATSLGEWEFHGTYLLPPLFFGGAGPIPYEELFFVGIVGPVAAVAFYEWFDDDLM